RARHGSRRGERSEAYGEGAGISGASPPCAEGGDRGPMTTDSDRLYHQPEVLSRLTEARIVEQMPWKQLPSLYQEVTGDTADWRTLRTVVMKDAGAASLPARVNARVRASIEQAFDRADLAKLVVHALTARFHEWSLLNDRMLRSI